jgi:hypothetical protein
MAVIMNPRRFAWHDFHNRATVLFLTADALYVCFKSKGSDKYWANHFKSLLDLR